MNAGFVEQQALVSSGRGRQTTNGLAARLKFARHVTVMEPCNRAVLPATTRSRFETRLGAGD